jgi:hypothetical protein
MTIAGMQDEAYAPLALSQTRGDDKALRKAYFATGLS